MPSPLRLRQRLCACMMAHGAAAYERAIAPHKQRLFSRLNDLGPQPSIVELGPGAGPNIAYLPRTGAVRYTAVEPNPFMHRHLSCAANRAGVALTLVPTTADQAPLPPASADAVICTLVLCSVPDPAPVLAHARRLLRPGGLFLFIEHVAAPRGTLLRRAQCVLRPVWRLLGDGCEPDRETWATIEAAGFAALSLDRFRVQVPIVSPHIAGCATA